MIDFHSHILPAVDDGSKDTEESLALLRMLAEQGVDTVVATPHFYANSETVEQFLGRRAAALETLQNAVTPDLPRILLGAEVKYYEGVSRLAALDALCMEGTRLLLLEMPMSRWTEYTVREVIDLASLRGLTVVLAHVERYHDRQSAAVWQRLLDNDVLMQVNATYFTDLATRAQAIRRLKRGEIHLLGSDCHDVAVRPPYLDQAAARIQKKLGDAFFQHMVSYSHELLL